jgi:hypothetical protein
MATSQGAGSSLVRASLAIHEPPLGDSKSPGALIRNFAFDFNPSQVQMSRRARWQVTPVQMERDGATPEFMGVDPLEMSLEIFLDSSDKPTSGVVQKNVDALMGCLEVTTASIAAKKPSPPWVVFQWGSFSTARFAAYVSSLTTSFLLFGQSGVPIRASCQLQLNAIPGSTEGQNPTSGALTTQRVHRVVAGDSLQSLAWREYGNANAWRTIAEANDIDNPAHLPAGTELLMPAAEEVLH